MQAVDRATVSLLFRSDDTLADRGLGVPGCVSHEDCSSSGAREIRMWRSVEGTRGYQGVGGMMRETTAGAIVFCAAALEGLAER